MRFDPNKNCRGEILFSTSRVNTVRGEFRDGMGDKSPALSCLHKCELGACLAAQKKTRHLPFQLKHGSSSNPLLIKKIFTIGSIESKPL